MKDLLVYTADADAQAVIQAILKRHQSLGIHEVDAEVKRHPLRDSGIIQSGAELVRMEKGHYGKVLLMWDYHGSGRERRQTVEQSRAEIQDKLDTYTWKGKSTTVILDPELEEWLWHNLPSIATHLRWSVPKLEQAIENFILSSGHSRDVIFQDYPKELFEFVMRNEAKRTISPRDFEQIAQRASLRDWETSPSFRTLSKILKTWFPKT